jgi:hypothetical protein
VYRSRQKAFRGLASIGLVGLALVTITAIGAYTWNNRQLPPPLTAQRDLPHRMRTLFVRLIERFVVRRPLARAGFFFALQTLWRSGTHRLTMAIAMAVGLALTTVAARGADAEQLLVIQPMVLLVLLTAFRHAARVPGDLRANWAFQMCWSGAPNPYMAGVKRAALLGVAWPALLILLPLEIGLLGWPYAVAHLLMGALLAAVVIEIEMLAFQTLPFASSYAGGGNLKGWLPVFVIAFWPIADLLANLEAAALKSRPAALVFVVVLLAGLPAIRLFARRQRDSYGPVDFYEMPGQTQRLDLSV